MQTEIQGLGSAQMNFSTYRHLDQAVNVLPNYESQSRGFLQKRAIQHSVTDLTVVFHKNVPDKKLRHSTHTLTVQGLYEAELGIGTAKS